MTEHLKLIKENAEHNDKVVDKVNWKNQELKKQLEEYKDKINKAIEYMEQWGKEPDADMYMQMKDYNEFKYLLKILKEDNKEE